MRILLTESASLTARETLTVLGKDGISVDLLDSGGLSLSRFTRWRGRLIKAPSGGADPSRYGQVQALFDHGRLVAAHTAVQIAVGAGGSAAARLSVNHSTAVKHAGAAMSRPPWPACCCAAARSGKPKRC